MFLEQCLTFTRGNYMQVNHVFSGILTAAVLCAGMDVSAAQMQATKQPAAATTTTSTPAAAQKPGQKAGYTRNQKVIGTVAVVATGYAAWKYVVSPWNERRKVANKDAADKAKDAAEKRKVQEKNDRRAALNAELTELYLKGAFVEAAGNRVPNVFARVLEKADADSIVRIQAAQ